MYVVLWCSTIKLYMFRIDCADFFMLLTDGLTKRLSDLIDVEDYDEWLPMSALSPSPHSMSDSSNPSPHIRLKMRYKHDIILPLRDYHDLQTVRVTFHITIQYHT